MLVALLCYIVFITDNTDYYTVTYCAQLYCIMYTILYFTELWYCTVYYTLLTIRFCTTYHVLYYSSLITLCLLILGIILQLAEEDVLPAEAADVLLGFVRQKDERIMTLYTLFQ